MENEIEKKFEQMGARVKVTMLPPNQFVMRSNRQWARPAAVTRLRIDVRNDREGSYFEILHRSDVHLSVLDVEAKHRHLLLMARASGRRDDPQIKSKFLCGHDERAWFVAAIPESAPAADVQGAKDALKPQEVWDAMREFGVHPHDRDRRRTAAFVRQGEWFFIPRPELVVDGPVLRDEPIRRGSGKPHMCQFLFRTGGERVFVNRQYPNGVSEREFSELPREHRDRGWRTMRRNACVFVRGAIRHSDHETITLHGWHEVVMNTETQAQAMSQMAFLD